MIIDVIFQASISPRHISASGCRAVYHFTVRVTRILLSCLSRRVAVPS